MIIEESLKDLKEQMNRYLSMERSFLLNEGEVFSHNYPFQLDLMTIIEKADKTCYIFQFEDCGETYYATIEFTPDTRSFNYVKKERLKPEWRDKIGQNKK
jgi:hypothetical protein